MKNKKIFCWCSDLTPNNGEGILGRAFVEKIFNQKETELYIKTNYGEYLFKNNKFFFKKKNYYPDFSKKYILPFYGVIYLIIKNLQNYKTAYINYLPLWNFLIFFFLPKRTIIGPITGTTIINSKKIFDLFFRKYLMKFFFNISLSFIYRKYNYCVFATENLKKFIDQKYVNKYVFNFIFQCLNFSGKLKNKSIDFIFYLKNHKNKTNSLLIKYIKLLSKKNYKICVVGDTIKFKNVKNLGFISRNKLKKIMETSRFAINSGENLYSLFALDCYSSNVIVFNHIKLKPKKRLLDKNIFRFIDLKDLNKTIKEISRINQYFRVKKIVNKKIRIINSDNLKKVKKAILI